MTDMPTWVAAPSLRVDLVTAVRTRVPARPELWHLESAVRGVSNLKTFISGKVGVLSSRGLRVDHAGTLRGYRGGTGGPD